MNREFKESYINSKKIGTNLKIGTNRVLEIKNSENDVIYSMFSWDKIADINHTTLDATWNINLSSNNKYSQYYKYYCYDIVGSDWAGCYWVINEIFITAKLKNGSIWSQPALTDNGTIGGSSFAVFSNIEGAYDQCYKAFDGLYGKNTTWFHSPNFGTTIVDKYIIMYFPQPVCITNLLIYNQEDYSQWFNRSTKTGAIYYDKNTQ